MEKVDYRFVEHSRLHSKDNPIINYLEGIGFKIYTYKSDEGTGLTLTGEFNDAPIVVDLEKFTEKVEVIRAGSNKEFCGTVETPEEMEETLNQITQK